MICSISSSYSPLLISCTRFFRCSDSGAIYFPVSLLARSPYHRMRDSCRTAYRTAAAAYAVKGFLCAFLKLSSLCVCNILHDIEILRTRLRAGVAADTAIDLRIKLHHHLLVRLKLLNLVCTLIRREKRNTCNIHSLFNLSLTGKTRLQLILSFNAVNRCTAPQKPWRQPHPLFNVYPAYSMAVMIVRSAGTLYFLPKKYTFTIFPCRCFLSLFMYI